MNYLTLKQCVYEQISDWQVESDKYLDSFDASDVVEVPRGLAVGRVLLRERGLQDQLLSLEMLIKPEESLIEDQQ